RLPLELPDTRRYFALGFPSTAQYSETRFRSARTQAMEHVRAARALRQLPVLTNALEDAELSWSLLAEITRVATKDSEDEWLAFATKHGFHRTRAEVRSAREEKRSRPRRGEYGLPRLSQRFSLSLAPEEMALVELVLADVAAAAGKRLGSASHEPIESVGDEGDDGGAEWMDDLPAVDPKTAFLLLCRVFHETEGGVDGFLSSRTPRKDGPYAVAFKQCPTC